ncbi:YcaO-like family protein [Ramlibacter humi]|nr:YcaO-like family protein [Ramlibacter humi]
MQVERIDALADASFQLARARLQWPGGRQSEGWGRDADLQLAGLKAVAEAVERHACESLPPSAVRSAAAALPRWMHPDLFVRYADAQYASPTFPFVRLDAGEQRWWIPAESMDDGRATFVLADCACLSDAFDAAYRRRLVTSATTSGCATGASVGDAIGRATLELVERDAFMRHWLRQAPGAEIDDESLPGRARRRLADLRHAGCRAGAQWLTLGVQPALLAWAQHDERAFTCVGSACGFDADAALESAMNELETMARARLEGVPEVPIAPVQVRGPADHGALYATRAHFRDADALLAAGLGNGVAFSKVAATLSRDVAELQQRLRMRGHSLCWMDLTVPHAVSLIEGIALHTVRVVAPGLVPMAFGHGLLPLGMLENIEAGGGRVHPFC